LLLEEILEAAEASLADGHCRAAHVGLIKTILTTVKTWRLEQHVGDIFMLIGIGRHFIWHSHCEAMELCIERTAELPTRVLRQVSEIVIPNVHALQAKRVLREVQGLMQENESLRLFLENEEKGRVFNLIRFTHFSVPQYCDDRMPRNAS
jgi:hypothetical protein